MLQKQKSFHLNLTNNCTLISYSNYVENNCTPLLMLGIYLYVLIGDKLNWNTHTNNIVSKLMRANSILSKLRYYVNIVILRTIYFVIFHSYLTYVMAVQGKNSPRIPQKHITVLQKKALRIRSFAPFSSHSSFYFHDYNILKFCDISNIEACAFIDNCFNSI